MAKEVEVTETKTNTFRLFNKIEYNPVSVPKSWGIDATFWVRPMTNTEKALFDFGEESCEDTTLVRAMIENDISSDDYEEVDGERRFKKSSMSKMSKAVESVVQAKKNVSKDEKLTQLNNRKEAVVACVEKFTIDGEEAVMFDNDQYEELDGATATKWLLQQVKSAGELTGAERIGL